MKQVAALLALVFASVALVACGGGGSSSSSESTAEAGGGATAKEESSGGGGGSTVKVEADPQGALAYIPSEATTKAGKVTIDFDNPQALTHDLVLEDSKGEDVARVELLSEGEDSTTVDLKPGTYHYFCSVPGHREAGMEGTLTVK